MTWHAKETIRSIYDIDDCDLAAELVEQLSQDLADGLMPPEVRALGHTIARWRDQIVAWHQPRVSNGPTEAVNNLVKRVKRVAFGITNFGNYRIRALLYAGKPNWNLLPTLTPR
jgi:transposase